MKNKKLLWQILTVILVVCLLTTLFVGCKKNEKKPEEVPVPAAEALAAIIDGAKASVAQGKMEDLVVSAKLDVKTTVDSTVNNYSIYFDLGLSLVSRDYKNTNNTFLKAEVKSGNDVVLGLYYDDDKTMNTKGDNAMSGNKLYLQYKDGNSMKKVALNVPYIGGTMTALDAFVYFKDINLQDEEVWETVQGYGEMIAGFELFSAASVSSSSASLTLDLGKLLAPDGMVTKLLEDVGEEIDNYVTALNIDSTLSGLLGLLPAIKLNVTTPFDDDGAIDDIKLDIELTDINDIEIKTVKDGNKKTLAYIGLDPNSVKVELTLDYKVNDGSVNTFNQGAKSGYTAKSLLNMKSGLCIELSDNINIALGSFNIGINAGKYQLTFNVDADPTRVLKALFTYEEADPTFDETETYYIAKNAEVNYYEKVLEPKASDIATYYTRKANFSFNSTEGIINAVVTILNCVDSAELELKLIEKNSKTPTGVEIGDMPISIKIGRQEGELVADLWVGVLGTPITTRDEATPNEPVFTGIESALGLITQLFDDEEDTNEDNTMEILQTVGAYLLKAYIGINDKDTSTGDFVVKFEETSFDINSTTGLTVSVDIDSKSKAEVKIGLDINKGVTAQNGESVEANLDINITLDSNGLAIKVDGLGSVKDENGASLGLPTELTITISNGSFSIFDYAGIVVE